MTTTQEITTVFAQLEKNHQPTMLEELGNYSPFQMLVMTLLSSRTRDSTTIPLVKKLFKEYPAPQHFIKLPIKTLEQKLHGIGFYHIKAKHVKELSKILIEKFHGQVPDTLEELTSLPGVGRKTANCILAYTFQKPAIPVDIHVHRIANRLGWIKTETPEESEEALQKLIPKDQWINVNRLLVGHGQTICSPINPKCTICPVRKYCEYGKSH
ncbi:TPA: endonuclease III [Candidatus Woesearchaeota archaeon]|nr:endonuclease III [Candidatus Woesearchaeota archaeon]HIG93003.1 endonuclease III [Candidatus Woesearchaeota archaeon]HIH13340.1 endonuclease III [Candidatus Woesearchaeota archaeon]